MIKNIVSDGYLERGIEFADITTLQGRMKGKKSIYADLQGKTIGWFRMSFIAVSSDEFGVLREAVCTIQIIDEYKRREQSLIYKSMTDELTGCYNRRAYEDDLLKYDNKEYIYVSMDVDGHCNMDIYKLLDIFFDKNIKINLDNDTYKIIKDGSEEHSRYGSMSQWIKTVIKGNIIHPDDLGNFIFHADKEYLKHHFSLTRKYVRVYYRKTVNDRYENTVMEILPVEDYSVNNRQVFLYVKINM